ncbi:hypothetical protein DVH24_026464 [Malus domestica]|uniref:Pentatricopeptide repeat-containing protein n=1 Tax=Malus domestica TaxID=3750 RepID=A0A498KI02_MALDO|nr:hypothetical protein DVH24_026464 [Malus domestica]
MPYFVKAEKVEYAWDLFRRLPSKGIQPNTRMYNTMISGFCNGGVICETENLHREMEEKSCSPDGWTYNTIIRGFINNNVTSMGVRLIQEMVERSFSADALTTELIVNLLSKDRVDATFFDKFRCLLPLNAILEEGVVPRSSLVQVAIRSCIA